MYKCMYKCEHCKRASQSIIYLAIVIKLFKIYLLKSFLSFSFRRRINSQQQLNSLRFINAKLLLQ